MKKYFEKGLYKNSLAKKRESLLVEIQQNPRWAETASTVTSFNKIAAKRNGRALASVQELVESELGLFVS